MKMQKYLWMFLIGMLMTSCINTKKMICLEDMKVEEGYPIKNKMEMKIQPDDRLTIQITSKNPELAIPFNLSGEMVQVSGSGEIASTSSESRKVARGYIVNAKGDIELPILGKIHVDGMTRQELEDKIKSMLVEENLINDPLVLIDITNLKIAVMGEVNHVGVLDVADNRITLMEALTRAGGMTSNAKPEQVAVIREEGGERKMYMHNVRSTEIFDSPCYYLQQNDIVYVYPQAPKATEREDRSWRYYSLGVGFVSFIMSLAILLK